MRLSFFVICFITIFINVSCNKKKNNRPKDFDEFWNKTIVELNKTPLEFEKIKKDSFFEGK